MCGIAGFASLEGPLANSDGLAAMLSAIAHRGPDGEGSHVDLADGIALGHRALHIRDTHTPPAQPMASADGRAVLSFNGEIYNDAKLKQELSAGGRRFETRVDTEVVLAAYERWGPGFVERLEGDFAIAIWDGVERTLHLFRDRLGVCPLYYTEAGGALVFASEIKGVLAHPAVARRPNLNRLGALVGHLYVPGRETAFENLFELLPGEHLAVRNGRIEIDRYHDFRFLPEVRALPRAEQLEELSVRLREATRRRRVADVPVGLYLSGGIDSSLVLASASQAGGLEGLDSYSLGFEGGALSEFDYAREAAAAFGGRLTEFLENGIDPGVVADRVHRHFDEPVPQPVAVPQELLARHAQAHIGVAFSGAGGDELFAGYDHYRIAGNLASGGTPPPGDAAMQGYQAGLDAAEIAAEFKSCSQWPLVARLAPGAQDPRPLLRPWFENNDYPDFVSRMQAMDLKTHFLSSLNKDDRMNLAVGLEARHPFLDHRMAEFALSMSPELKLRDGTTKAALKDLASRHFGHDFVHRPKAVFPSPVTDWLRRRAADAQFPALAEVFGDALAIGEMQRLAGDFASGETAHTRRVWGLFSLETWARTNFLDA